MRQALQLKIGQSLAMTPQLQQAIKLLQLSTLELQTEIQEALESNPLLEQVDDGVDVDSDGNVAESESAAESKSTTSVEIASAEAPATPTDSSEQNNTQSNENLPEEFAVDTSWEDVYDDTFEASRTPMVGQSDERQTDFTEYTAGAEENLQDHLLEQLHLMTLTDSDREICAYLVDSLDEDGYLRADLIEILEALNDSVSAEEDLLGLEEAEACLHLIQSLDPVGCGARDLGECLSVQLSQLPESMTRNLAIKVARDHMDLLAARELPKIRRLEQVNETQLNEALDLIRSVDPKPGSRLSVSEPQYIVPDVIVKPFEGGWRVELNPEIAPKLAINQSYASLIKRADKSDDNVFIRNNLQEARWFIKSLQSRNETLLRVASAIVEFQIDYFNHGDVAMKPLVLRDIAEKLELHESTISRVTTQKYMNTPRGNLEFKYFFSSHVSTSDGGECSATAIRAHIKELVSAEDPKKPLSDNKIASLLVARGINVARRTIAKYREAMAIPPSNERKLIS